MDEYKFNDSVPKDIRKCEVCHRERQVIVACGLYPISRAYCAECLTLGAEPFTDWVMLLSMYSDGPASYDMEGALSYYDGHYIEGDEIIALSNWREMHKQMEEDLEATYRSEAEQRNSWSEEEYQENYKEAVMLGELDEIPR